MRTTNYVLMTLAASLMLTSTAMAQGFRGGGGMGMDMLRNEAVQKELDLVPDQMEKLTAIGEKAQGMFREMFSGFRDLSAEERQAKMEEIREKMEEARENLETEIKDVLLPQQIDRLQQISLQRRMRYMGTSGVLGSDTLAEKLGITEEQKKKLQEKQQKVQEELNKKIQKLREEAREELMQVLTPEQQKTLKEMIGEPFEMPQQQGRGGFQRGGGPRGGGPRGGR